MALFIVATWPSLFLVFFCRVLVCFRLETFGVGGRHFEEVIILIVLVLLAVMVMVCSDLQP
jgi:hypothetical protein